MQPQSDKYEQQVTTQMPEIRLAFSEFDKAQMQKPVLGEETRAWVSTNFPLVGRERRLPRPSSGGFRPLYWAFVSAVSMYVSAPKPWGFDPFFGRHKARSVTAKDFNHMWD